MLIRLSGTLLRFADYQKEFRIEAPTLKDGLQALSAQYPEVGKALLDRLGQLRATHRVFVNGVMVDRGQLDRAMSGEDVIDITTAITGG